MDYPALALALFAGIVVFCAVLYAGWDWMLQSVAETQRQLDHDRQVRRMRLS